MARPRKETGLVQPLIRVEGEKHALETLLEGDPNDLPVLKSIGYAPLGKSNQWVSYVITTKGKEVLSIEISEPDLRAIAEESSKINFVNQFMNVGL